MKARHTISTIVRGMLFLAAVLSLAQTSAAQDDMESVDNSVFERPARTPARFVHEAHNEKADVWDCAVCHHLYEDGELLADESSEDQQCIECHALKGDDDNPVGLRRAYHLRCKGCHLERNAGPVMCAECHVGQP